MGGYSTSLYLGLALGSFALGPVITHQGYVSGFTAGAAAGAVGTLLASGLWLMATRIRRQDLTFPRGERFRLGLPWMTV